MYDMTAQLRDIPDDHMNAKTIIVSCGVLNFEDSNYSKRKCKEVQKYLHHDPTSYDRNDWCDKVEPGKISSDKELMKKIRMSLAYNYPDLVKDRNVMIVDCTLLHDPDADKGLRGHAGTHPKICQGVVWHKKFLTAQQQLQNFDHAGKNLIVNMCKSGRHRAEAMKRVQRQPIAKYF